MKPFFTLVLLCVNFMAHAQELIKTDWEQGYAKDGKKYSVWQYFNSKKEPELVINHTTGRVMFVSKDTSNYVILRDGHWVTSKLDVRPVPVAGTHNLYQSIYDTLKYPLKDFRKGLEGKVIITFDVDTAGLTTNHKIIKSIGGSCDSAVLAAFKVVDPKWIPARLGKKKCQTRFAIGYEFRLNEYESPLEHEEFKVDSENAKLLDEFVVKGPNNGDKVFSFVEQQAEFPGGQEGLAIWLSKNLKYPSSASRMGLQGQVYVKFIIEPDGSVTNAEVVKGFDVDCNNEALRTVSIMPKWKPGKQSGRTVRSYFTQVIYFKLEQ